MAMFGLGTLVRVAGELRRDLGAARERDPATRGVGATEILATWPGVHALLYHRIAHVLDELGLPGLPRAIAYASRTLTGIEIHPAARIGHGFFVDHGAWASLSARPREIGDDVTLFQGVTLGGTGFATGKRHPTLRGQRHRSARAPSCWGR